MKQLAAGLRRIAAAREALEEAGQAARRDVLSSARPDGAELAQLAGCLRRLKDEDRRLAESKRRQEQQIASRREALLEARRRLRLLERLKERCWEEWRREQEQEIESLAAETFLARRQAAVRRTNSQPGR